MAGRRGFPWRIYIGLAVLILLFGASPILALILADIVAGLNGCSLNEGMQSACMVGGSDWGPTLYSFYVLPWLMLATLPLAGGALLVWLTILIIHYFAWRRFNKVPS